MIKINIYKNLNNLNKSENFYFQRKNSNFHINVFYENKFFLLLASVLGKTHHNIKGKFQTKIKKYYLHNSYVAI